MAKEEKSHPPVPLWTEIAGWYGAIAIMGAYCLVSFGLAEGEGIWFQLLNLTGALGLLAIGWAKRVKQNILLNLFWAAIGVVAIINILT